MTPSRELDFEDLRVRYLWPLQNFLTFATDRPAAITRVRATLQGEVKRTEMLFRHPFESDDPFYHHQMLFRFGDIAARLSAVVEQWFVLCDELGPCLSQVMSALYGNFKFADIRFLAMAHAVESYHRRRYPVTSSEIEAHKQRVDQIILRDDKANKAWLKGKLKYAYEPFFSERLATFFSSFDRQFVMPMFAEVTEQRKAAKEIAEWRNKLTHLNATQEEIDSGLGRLHIFANQMLTFMKAEVLRELGFTGSQLEQCFTNNDIYRYFSRVEP
jgi:hypothetical protein